MLHAGYAILPGRLQSTGGGGGGDDTGIVHGGGGGGGGGVVQGGGYGGASPGRIVKEVEVGKSAVGPELPALYSGHEEPWCQKPTTMICL